MKPIPLALLAITLAQAASTNDARLLYMTPEQIKWLDTEYGRPIAGDGPFNYVTINASGVWSAPELTLRFTNKPDGSKDYHATNMVMTTRFEPVVIKTNGQWEVRFREPVTNEALFKVYVGTITESLPPYDLREFSKEMKALLASSVTNQLSGQALVTTDWQYDPERKRAEQERLKPMKPLFEIRPEDFTPAVGYWRPYTFSPPLLTRELGYRSDGTVVWRFAPEGK